VNALSRQSTQSREAGLGLMEAIVGVLLGLIIASLVLHVGRMGLAMYRVNSTTGGIAQELELARTQALSTRTNVSVIFQAKEKRFGLDRNGNSRLDNFEAEDLPSGVDISEDAIITFSRSGYLAPGSTQPTIVISSTRESRRVSVSKAGAIETD
jgi:Tfp pilus assembly protein FimT